MANPYPITPRQLDLVSLSGSHMAEQGVYPDIKMGVIASYNVSSGSTETVLKSTASGGLTLASLNVQGNSTLRNVLPESTDTYDLGSSINLWRKGWLSELDTIIFAENTVALVGGWLIIGKDQGSIPSFVDSTDTTIDFGKPMIVGGSVVLRSSLQVEYIGTGSLASGSTVYNVVRDLDGSGANDWVEGSVFLVLGESGDGRIELNAYDTPRIQLIQQGETYNQQKEIIRIGDLNGNWNYSSEEWGVAIGSYGSGSGNVTIDSINGVRINIYDTPVMEFKSTGAFISNILNMSGANAAIAIGATPPTSSSTGTGIWLSKDGLFSLASNVYQIKIDATNGKLYAGGGEVVLDIDGLAFQTAPTISNANGIRWVTTTTMRGQIISTYSQVTGLSNLFIKTVADTGGILKLNVTDTGATYDTYIQIVGGSSGTIEFNGTGYFNNNLRVTGNYISYKNSTEYTGYIFVPLTTPLTSTSWDGDSFSTTAKTLIDLSAVFGVPAGVKAVLIRIQAWDSGSAGATSNWFGVSPNNTNGSLVVVGRCAGLPNNVRGDETGWCPCNSNGDIYYQNAATGTNTMGVDLQIWGYAI